MLNFRQYLTILKEKISPHTLRAQVQHLGKSNLLRVVIGSSGLADEGWVKTNKTDLDLLKAQDWKRLFQNRLADAMLAEHVWEHLTEDEGAKAFQLCYQYLKPGGYLRIAVPDGYHPDPNYIEWVRVGGSGPGSDDHKVLYNYESLSRPLLNAGFTISLLEYFDEKGQFHQNPWSTQQGTIRRSKDLDSRNINGELKYTSLIIDAKKPIDVKNNPQ